MAPAWHITPEIKHKLETAARHVHETAAELQKLSGMRDQAEARAEHARMVFVMTCNDLLPILPPEIIGREN